MGVSVAPLKIVQRDNESFAVYTSAENKSRLHYIPPDKAELLRRCALEALSGENSGYLYALDRQGFVRFLTENVYYPSGLIQAALGRASRFRSAGVPPIFVAEMENRQAWGVFPVLDEIILIGGGNWESRVAQAAMARDESVGKPDHRGLLAMVHSRPESKLVFVPPCEPSDVFDFARRAFDDGQMNQDFIRDLAFRNLERSPKGTQVDHLKESEARVGYLHTMLSPFIPAKSVYPTTYAEEVDLSFTSHKRFWHLDYSPADRRKVAQLFWDKVISHELPRNSTAMRRIKAVFPDLEAYDMSMVSMLDVRSACAASFKLDGDFRGVGQAVMQDEALADLRVEFMARLEAWLGVVARTRPEVFLLPRDYLCGALNLQTGMRQFIEIRRLFLKYRVIGMCHLSDDKFLEKFGNLQSLGAWWSSIDPDTPEAPHVQLREYIMKRRERLGFQ